jgi:hypothetical protein
MPDHISATPV